VAVTSAFFEIDRICRATEFRLGTGAYVGPAGENGMYIGGGQTMVLNSAVTTCWTPTMYIGNVSGAFVRIGNQTKSYLEMSSDSSYIQFINKGKQYWPFLESHRSACDSVESNQIVQNNVNISTQGELDTLSTELITQTNRISSNLGKINSNTTNISANTTSINGLLNQTKINAEFNYEDSHIIGQQLVSGSQIGDVTTYHDMDLGLSIRVADDKYFLNTDTSISADFGTLHFILNVNYANESDVNSYIFGLQTELIVCDNSGAFVYYRSSRQGHKTTNVPTVVYSNYNVQNSVLLKFRHTWIGKFIRLRTFYHFQVASPSSTSKKPTLSGNMQVIEI